MTANIKARNLRPIVDALKLHTCEYIQAYDPLELDQADDLTAPYVKSIDVELIRGPSSARKEA